MNPELYDCSPGILAPQRGVPQSPCNIDNFWTIIFCDVSKTTLLAPGARAT